LSGTGVGKRNERGEVLRIYHALEQKETNRHSAIALDALQTANVSFLRHGTRSSQQ
jgi:hypothetical protein